jgi:predicted TIM-barrel fold metal-dependent hydrolase
MTRNRIDVHAHYLGGTMGELIAAGVRLPGNYKMPVLWTVDETLAHMDRNEIGTQILSIPWGGVGTAEDPDLAVRFCRSVNEECAELIAKYPDRFGAFASVPLNSPDLALAEIAHGVDELGLDGVVLTTNSLGRYFGQACYEPILAELDRRRIPVFVHPIDSPCIKELSLGRPSSVVEFPFDTARTITNAIYGGVFQRYPDLTLILAHAGGALPALGWRIAEHTAMGRGGEDADIDAHHVADVLRGLYYDTALAGSGHSLLPALQVTGADHILFGTDWPAAPEPTVVHTIDNLEAFGFSDDELSGIERSNAIALFSRLGSARDRETSGGGSRPSTRD